MSIRRFPREPSTSYLCGDKGRVQCGFSQNLTSPPLLLEEIEIDLPSKVKIGLTASNISAKPYAASFENFAVINSETDLEVLFGDVEIPKDKKAK